MVDECWNNLSLSYVLNTTRTLPKECLDFLYRLHVWTAAFREVTMTNFHTHTPPNKNSHLHRVVNSWSTIALSIEWCNTGDVGLEVFSSAHTQDCIQMHIYLPSCLYFVWVVFACGSARAYIGVCWPTCGIPYLSKICQRYQSSRLEVFRNLNVVTKAYSSGSPWGNTSLRKESTLCIITNNSRLTRSISVVSNDYVLITFFCLQIAVRGVDLRLLDPVCALCVFLTDV